MKFSPESTIAIKKHFEQQGVFMKDVLKGIACDKYQLSGIINGHRMFSEKVMKEIEQRLPGYKIVNQNGEAMILLKSDLIDMTHQVVKQEFPDLRTDQPSEETLSITCSAYMRDEIVKPVLDEFCKRQFFIDKYLDHKNGLMLVW